MKPIDIALTRLAAGQYSLAHRTHNVTAVVVDALGVAMTNNAHTGVARRPHPAGTAGQAR